MEIQKDKDPLGTRMKEQYENRTRYYLPRRTYTIIRLDGCHFKTYTHGLDKPFDKGLMEDIDNSIITMLPQVQGVVFAYTQSDEISLLLTDFATPNTSAWFDANLQKMVSVSASLMTGSFNYNRFKRELSQKIENRTLGDSKAFVLASFDSRCFTIPDRIEVMNYFIHRNQDCSRNSVSMVAQSLFSPKELHGKSTPEMHEMMKTVGKNWATDYTDGEKNGRLIVKETYDVSVSIPDVPNFKVNSMAVQRTRWIAQGAWKFTENKEKLLTMIPSYPL